MPRTINGAIAPPIELPLSNSAVAKARSRFGNHSPDDFGRSWPVPRFARSQQEAKSHKTVEAACQRSQHRRYRVPGDCQSQTPPCADAIHQPAAYRLPDGVGHAESDDYVSVVGIGPVVLQLKIRGEKRKGLAV